MRSDEIPIIGKTKLDVPGLGTVFGITYNDAVCQFLGIPYGTIPGRFRKSNLVTEWENNQWDGTKLGPICPQPPRDFYPIPSPARPWVEMPGSDEFNCLNLNISVPRLPNDAEGKEPLPVMVFIHGGAFTYSAGSSPVYDGRIIASMSKKMLSRPTIVVTINYRLGVYGFLAGTDIQEYNEACGETGVGNYGIWDQIIALRWIQRNIAAFGGDPSKVTVFGQSAGGISVHCLLLRNERLFSSAILQSGMNPMLGVDSVQQSQKIYERMLRHLGIPLHLSWRERLNRLLQVSEAKLTKTMIPVYITPVICMPICDDKVLVPGGIPNITEYPSTFRAPEWCQRIMLGDCRSEGIIFNKAWANMSKEGQMAPGKDTSAPVAELVLKRMREVLGESSAAKIAEQYSLRSDTSPGHVFQKLEQLTTHGSFTLDIYLAAKSAAEHCPEVYAYHFDVPSPFENSWKGLAHHSFDNVLVWGVMRHLLPEAHQIAGDRLTEAWVKFANGEEPWERYSKRKAWQIYTLNGATVATEEDDDSWGYSIWHELGRQNLLPDLSRLSAELCLRKQTLMNE